jgi:glutaminyl-tRNA synthetase
VPDDIFYGSDYFDKCYEYAVKLIKDGKAYVCDLDAEQLRAYRGTLTEPGQNSPYRDRSEEENLGAFPANEKRGVSRRFKNSAGKIDMSLRI